ncbi:MAG: OB-fold domain-containing protein [Acidimicrobiia bacterium]|nr:OB-fold domain-containing protein [Acidimicrobiia bacterium]
MTEILLPARLQDVEAVRSVRTPASIQYSYTPGQASSRYLKGIAQRKIIGARVEPGAKVYVPPRGADPQLGKPTTEQVEVGDRGTLVSFCVVNVSFHGGTQEIPYTTGNILLDGSDQPIMHLIQECPVDQVRIGMRLEAVWVDDADLGPTMESIRWFRPLDEPDLDVHIPGEDRPLWLDSEEFNQ